MLLIFFHFTPGIFYAFLPGHGGLCPYPPQCECVDLLWLSNWYLNVKQKMLSINQYTAWLRHIELVIQIDRVLTSSRRAVFRSLSYSFVILFIVSRRSSNSRCTVFLFRIRQQWSQCEVTWFYTHLSMHELHQLTHSIKNVGKFHVSTWYSLND